jgi:hypothetical protein
MSSLFAKDNPETDLHEVHSQKVVLTAANTEGDTVISRAPLSVPRLLMRPHRTGGSLLDGAWWPRSRDPAAELPGLVFALDERLGAVHQLKLGASGWESRPRRLVVDDRVITLAWFSSQPRGLLIALAASGQRLELLVVPSATADVAAKTAMAVAADHYNTVHTPGILAAMAAGHVPGLQETSASTWEGEGGYLQGKM